MEKLYYIVRPKSDRVKSIYLADDYIYYRNEPEWNDDNYSEPERSYLTTRWTSLPQKAVKLHKDQAEKLLRRYKAFVARRADKHVVICKREFDDATKKKAIIDKWIKEHNGAEPSWDEYKTLGIDRFWPNNYSNAVKAYNDALYHQKFGDQVKVEVAQEGLIDFDKKYKDASKRFKWHRTKSPQSIKCQSCGAKIPGGPVLSINGQYYICAFCVQLLMKDLDKQLAHIPPELHKEWKHQMFINKL